MSRKSLIAAAVRLAGSVWDFIDKRDIDKHVTTWAVFSVTIKLLFWSITFATISTRPGGEVAEIIAAIWAPWNIVQAAVLGWYFSRRNHPEQA